MTKAQSQAAGILYLVATPIGNLEDMTFRGVRTLQEADAVFCEDTRRTSILLTHFKIEPKAHPESFHDHSPKGVLQRIKRLLEEGKSVAYVTDGGLPVVSDPGFTLVRAANECGAKVIVIPGPSAAVMVFAASGLPSPKYLFHGFFPRTRGEVERTLEIVRQSPIVHVFYEAPGRISASLEILTRNIPESAAVVGRELTKIHEEIRRGSVQELYDDFKERGHIKGECVLAVMGGESRVATQSEMPVEEGVATIPIELTDAQKDEIASLVKSGQSSKDAAKELSKKFGVPRRVIYEYIIRYLT